MKDLRDLKDFDDTRCLNRVHWQTDSKFDTLGVR